MEEAAAVAVDCPPTPEILPLTSTPPPPSQLQVVYSSSSEEADESADGRSSPPPKCAICLGKCRQKAYANSCRHQFCFRCLLEWSKVKPECPLCKQRFNSIVHYKSFNCYEEHMIQTSNPLEQSLPREADFYRRLNFYVSDLPRITYHATLHMPTSQSELMQQLFMHQSSDVRRFIREFGDQVVPTRQNSIAWRQFIYRQRLYARPLPDVNGRFRVSSAHFYLMHPAQLHRILPWVEREVYAMETIAPTMSPPMATRMGYLLNSFDIDSPDFLRALAPYVCSSFREHFRHELFNFARSPYDMIGYDQCVQYEPRFNHRSHVILSSSDEELDSEQVDDGVVNMSEPVASTSSSSSSSMFAANSAGAVQGSTSGTSGRAGRTGRTQFRFEARSTNETVIMTGTLREARAEMEAFAAAAATTPVIELNDNSDSTGSASVPAATATTSTRSTLRDGDNISLSSSDSEDCQFVLAQKPPHLRTPDHVVDLESDYDSDVVFVAVESAGNQPAATNGDASEKHSLPLPKSDLSCEYNNGASTSSGYHGGAGSSGSGTSTRDNHYTRSRVNRYTGGMGVKSMYEASDSEEDEDDDNEDGELYTASPRSPASGSSICSSNSSSCPNVCTVSSHDKVVYNLRTSVTTVTRGRKRKRNSRKTKQTGAKKNWRTRQRSTSSSSSSTSSSEDSSTRKNVSTGSSNSSDSTRSSSATSSSSSSTSITSITSASASSASSESHPVEPSVVVKTSSDGRRIRLSTNWVAPKNKKNGKKDSKAEAAKPKTTRGNAAKKKGAQSKAARPQAAPKKASAAKSNTEQSGRSKRGKLSLKRPEEQSASSPMKTESSQEKGAKKVGQYFVQIRPSSSPTTEIATDDENTTAGGGGGRKRKLSRVIIKRYHQDDQPPETHPLGPQRKETDTSAAPGECSSAKRTKSDDPAASCAPNGTNNEPTPGCSRNTVIAKTEVVDAPSASGTDSDSDATAAGNWQDTASGTAASVIVSTSQFAQPTVLDSAAAAALQLPLMPDHEQLLEDANSVALDTLLRFSPTLHWASADPAPIEEHLSISVSDTLSPQTFSTITFSPSSTSVSPLAAMLAIPSSSVPELIEGIGSLASASQLPSSVVGAATIDGAIDELISIIPADAFNNTVSLTGVGPAGGGIEATESSSGALSSCSAPLPPGHDPTNPPGVQSVVAGSEVEL